MLGFDSKYEVCNCKKITIEDIKNCVINENARTLNEIQEKTTAGTECRHCIFPEGDFGKIKKKIYCKDILKEVLKECE